MAPTTLESAAELSEVASGADGLSKLITRILDQLSLSSWLPAIVLVCNSALLMQLHSQQNLNLAVAVIRLTKKPLGIIVVLILLIIVASIVTQAFEFEVIRVLEGYWGSRGVPRWLAMIRIRHHENRLRQLQEQLKTHTSSAFGAAKPGLKKAKVPRESIAILERLVQGKPLGRRYDPANVTKAEQYDWREYCPPEFLRPIDATVALIVRYPEPHRILPTKLGNTLRSGEDQLNLAPGEELEAFVYHRYKAMTPELKAEHDRYRAQLNIYSLLTFIFVSLTVMGPISLPHEMTDIIGEIAFSMSYAVLGFVSYQAAIASARGYATVLTAIGALAQANSASTASAPPS